MARPMATRWRWPPESCLGIRSSSPSSPRSLAASSARRLRSSARDAAHLEPVGDVVEHVHVRVEGVVLEHHRNVAILGFLAGDVLVADEDAAAGDFLKPGDAAQGRGLAAAGRPDHDHEGAVRDFDVDALQYLIFIESLFYVLELDACHAGILLAGLIFRFPRGHGRKASAYRAPPAGGAAYPEAQRP